MHRLPVAALAALALLLPASSPAQSPAWLDSWPAPRATGIAFDGAGNVYVSQFANHRIDVHAPDGSLLSQWGADGADPGSVSGPGHLAIDRDDHLFVAEWTTHNPDQSGVQEFSLTGSFLGSIGFHLPGCPGDPGAFFEPWGIAVAPDGRVYVTDVGCPRTQVFANDGTWLDEWPSQGNSIALDGAGHAFEVEEGGVVRKYDAASGAELAHWGSHGAGPGQFDMPVGIAVDAQGRVFVTDTYNHRVQVFTNDGGFLREWGGYGDGPGQFYRPMGIGVAADGRIYVADTWNGRVQVFESLATPTRAASWGAIKARLR